MQAYIPISPADHETFVVAGRRLVSQSIKMFAIDYNCSQLITNDRRIIL